MKWLTFIVVFVGWIFSLCLHEFSHALVAYYGGDYTVRDKGYLTFNPLKYTHPLYSLLLPMIFLLMGGIGLPGGAVYIESWRIRSRNWLSATSLAGPMSNLLVAFVLSLILNFSRTSTNPILPGLAFLAFLQIMAVTLNLIPVPPFDGFGVIEPFLNESVRMQFAQFRGAFIWIVFLVLWYVPFINHLFFNFVTFVAGLIGLPFGLVALGQQQFFFWQ